MVNSMKQQQQTKTLSACIMSNRKDTFVDKNLIIDHFRYLKEW